MYSALFKFVVTTLTILSANLLTTFLSDMLVSHKWEYKPLRFTLIAMGVITLIFYPLFAKLEVWLGKVSRKFLKAGKSVAGRYLGLILVFIAGLVILTYFYADLWYSINIFKLIGKGEIVRMF